MQLDFEYIAYMSAIAGGVSFMARMGARDWGSGSDQLVIRLYSVLVDVYGIVIISIFFLGMMTDPWPTTIIGDKDYQTMSMQSWYYSGRLLGVSWFIWSIFPLIPLFLVSAVVGRFIKWWARTPGRR